MGIFYRPEESVAADFIPFFHDGTYHLFYLRDWRNKERHGEGTPWFHLVTRDFVRFEDWGEALARGTEAEQDLYVFTGCALQAQGRFHIFYTGHNPHFRKSGKPEQAVMHATSDDLRTWTKQTQDTFYAPGLLEPHDWRDPFVYWDERFNAYGMLLAARKTSGPERNRGITALVTSLDFKTWTPREHFWAPDAYFTHECPDLFRIGEWRYLVYSTFSERCVTHYRKSRSLSGPWLLPDAADGGDTFDGRAFYAAKTAGDGRRRFAFGWLPTRDGEKDDGGFQWGGNLVVHELAQDAAGNLSVRAPEEVLASFGMPKPFMRASVLGAWDWNAAKAAANCDATSRFSATILGDLPDEALLETTITCSPDCAGAGLLLRADANLDSYYQVRLEPARQRVVVDRWKRAGDQPFMLERPVHLPVGAPVRLRVLVDGTCLVAYVNERVALSCRMYQRLGAQWGLFATEGRAAFEGLALRVRGSS
ncbi:MAG: GH32 C-terminal domain-containing protein [Planctomycetes bacterium]|nr:GH32 C-terminal domain-containing protein [Planctomycetota bacterium]